MKHAPNPKANSLWQIFRIPLALALVSGAGLLAALLGNGSWSDLLWSLAVAIPLIPILFGALGRSVPRKRTGSRSE